MPPPAAARASAGCWQSLCQGFALVLLPAWSSCRAGCLLLSWAGLSSHPAAALKGEEWHFPLGTQVGILKGERGSLWPCCCWQRGVEINSGVQKHHCKAAEQGRGLAGAGALLSPELGPALPKNRSSNTPLPWLEAQSAACHPQGSVTAGVVQGHLQLLSTFTPRWKESERGWMGDLVPWVS